MGFLSAFAERVSFLSAYTTMFGVLLFVLCALSMSSVCIVGAGHLPEAGFRRHAPGQRKNGCWWRWWIGSIWLLRTEVSSLGTYISLIGENSTSALLSPSTPPSRRFVKRCISPNSAKLALLLTKPIAVLSRPFHVKHSHRQLCLCEGNNKLSTSKTGWESKLHRVLLV